MRTFNHAVLFTKENCKPCELTKTFVAEEVDPLFYEYLSIFRKENHTALVTAYNLETYPTLLIVDAEGFEIDRVVGGKAIRSLLNQFLTEIHNARSF